MCFLRFFRKNRLKNLNPFSQIELCKQFNYIDVKLLIYYQKANVIILSVQCTHNQSFPTVFINQLIEITLKGLYIELNSRLVTMSFSPFHHEYWVVNRF